MKSLISLDLLLFGLKIGLYMSIITFTILFLIYLSQL